MADVTIDGLTLKATPVLTDQVEIQETSAGVSRKTTLTGVRSAVLARATTAEETSHPYRYTYTIPKTTDGAAKYGEAVPWQIETGYSDFAGQTFSDPIFAAGYNVDIALGKKDTAEPGVGYFVEGDYWDAGLGARTTELYCQHLDTAVTAQIRPWFYQINRATNRISAAHIQVPTATPLAFNLCDGTTTGSPQLLALSPNSLYLRNSGATSAQASLDVEGRVGNPSDAGGRLRIGYAASLTSATFEPETQTQFRISIDNTAALRLYKLNSSAVACIGGADNGASLTLDGVNVNSGNKGLVVRRHASANAAPLQIQTSASATVWEVDGNLNTIPAAGSASMTQGFTYIPSGAGAAGTPGTLPTGRVPMYVDTTGNRIGVYYGGSWRYAAVT